MNRFFSFLKTRFAYSDKETISPLAADDEKNAVRSTVPAAFSYIITAACSAAIFISYYIYSKDFCVKRLSDLGAHIAFAEKFDLTNSEGFLKSWARVPHLGWHMLVRFFMALHMPPEEAAALVYSLLGVFSFIAGAYLTYRLIRHYTGRDELALSAIISGVLSFVGPYAMPWFTPLGIYHGQYSPNPFHNPTHMAVKGLGIILTMIGVDIFRRMKNEKTVFFKSERNLILLFGIVLFISVIFKPTFMYMILPAGFLFMISELIINLRKKAYPMKNIFKVLIGIIIAVIPSLILIIIESAITAKYGTEYSTVIFSFSKPFEVWHLYTLSVPNSVLLAMFFPIVMCIINPGYFLKSTEGRLSVCAYAAGFVEFSILKDAGYQMIAANFAWCMMSGMVVLYAFTAGKLLIDTLKEDRSKPHMIYLISCWFLLFLHAYSGITFMLERPM